MDTVRSRRLADTSVAEAMHAGVFSCAPDATLLDVAETMAERNVHAIVVADGSRGGAPAGLISDLDLIAAATVRELQAQEAGGSAGSPALTVFPEDTLEHAAHLMTKHGTAHLVVVDPQSGQPAGVLSTLDIVSALVGV
jgi:signal-transduction protein with cAMP-binding, CBS, and nucleotidyltransferase domain